MTEGTTYHFQVNAETAGARLDQLIPRFVPDISRSRGQSLIGAGMVTVNGAATSKHFAVRDGDRIDVTAAPAGRRRRPLPEDIPLEILHEDANFVAVNKPAGMVVHPAPGHPGGTLVNALLGRDPQPLRHRRRGAPRHRPPPRQGHLRACPRRQERPRPPRARRAVRRARGREDLPRRRLGGPAARTRGVWDAAIGRDTKDRQKISVRTRYPRAARHPLAGAAAPPGRDAPGAAPRDGAHPPAPRPPRERAAPDPRRPDLRAARRARERLPARERQARLPRPPGAARLEDRASRPRARRTPMEITAPLPAGAGATRARRGAA